MLDGVLDGTLDGMFELTSRAAIPLIAQSDARAVCSVAGERADRASRQDNGKRPRKQTHGQLPTTSRKKRRTAR
jgi:hypothetical protein